MERVRGVVQHYAWGDTTSIPELLGVEPDGQPWAEVWFGTHPSAPATLADGRPLVDVAGPLPYLLKLLSAAEPLSLQTHPSGPRAAEGFDREERNGLAPDAPTRIYRDPSAKPELIVALTDFDALCGFRPAEEIDEVLTTLELRDLADSFAAGGLESAVAAIYHGDVDLDTVVSSCRRHRPRVREADLVVALADRYPDDPSVAVTLLLNRIALRPGEAAYLDAGNLHAYLHGTGVEVMGASDNVVRGGLTTKHVDVDELLTVLDFSPLEDPVVRPVEEARGRWTYATPGAPFRVSRLEIDPTVSLSAGDRELLLCTDGAFDRLARGTVGYLAPGADVVLNGSGTVFRVEESDG